MTAASEILGPRGLPATSTDVLRLEPPRGVGQPFFGWHGIVDGDPITIRIDAISGIMKNARTGHYVVLLRDTPALPELSDADAIRLMKRLGWRESSNGATV